MVQRVQITKMGVAFGGLIFASGHLEKVLAVLDEEVTQTVCERGCPHACSPENELLAAGFAPAGIGQTEYRDS